MSLESIRATTRPLVNESVCSPSVVHTRQVSPAFDDCRDHAGGQ
jgi:hypothetical protein